MRVHSGLSFNQIDRPSLGNLGDLFWLKPNGERVPVQAEHGYTAMEQGFPGPERQDAVKNALDAGWIRVRTGLTGDVFVEVMDIRDAKTLELVEDLTFRAKNEFGRAVIDVDARLPHLYGITVTDADIESAGNFKDAVRGAVEKRMIKWEPVTLPGRGLQSRENVQKTLEEYRTTFDVIRLHLGGARGIPREKQTVAFKVLGTPISLYRSGDYVDALVKLSDHVKNLDTTVSADPTLEAALRSRLSELKIAIDAQTKALFDQIEGKSKPEYFSKVELIYQNIEWKPGRRMSDYLAQGVAQSAGYKPDLKVTVFNNLASFNPRGSHSQQIQEFDRVFRGEHKAVESKDPISVSVTLRVPERPTFKPALKPSPKPPRGVIGLDAVLTPALDAQLNATLIKAEGLARSSPNREDDVKAIIFTLGTIVGSYNRDEIDAVQLAAYIAAVDGILDEWRKTPLWVTVSLLGLGTLILYLVFRKK